MAPRARKSGGGDDDLKAKKNFFKRLYPGFKKKATELSLLCDNSVGFICYGPDVNDLHVWPEPQDNPQALPQIVGKFNALSDHRRMSHACDLFDFPTLRGLSDDDLRNLLSYLDSHLIGVNQKKLTILRRGNSPQPPPKETDHHHHHLNIRVSGEDDHLLRVSDSNPAISNSVFLGSHEPVMDSPDIDVSDYFPVDLTPPPTDYFPVDLTPPDTDYFPVDNLGVCYIDNGGDSSYLSPADLEFLSALFPADDLFGSAVF